MSYELNMNDKELEKAAGAFKNAVSYKKEDGTIGYHYDVELIESTISYILRMLNDAARLGLIEFPQYRIILRDSIDGLFDEIYIKNYRVGEEIHRKDSLFVSAKIFMILLFSRVLQGRDRELAMEDIRAKAQKIIMGAPAK